MSDIEKFSKNKKYRWVRLKCKQEEFWKSIVGTYVRFKAENGVNGFPIFCGKIYLHSRANNMFFLKTHVIRGDLGVKSKLEPITFYSNTIRWMKKMTQEEVIMFNLLYGSISKGD
jgi:hypothetical protein